jgi:uncharacterized membrane protein YqaE (UPF0057 family)
MLKSIFVTADKTYIIKHNNLNNLYIKDLKQLIETKTDIPHELQTLRHFGKLLIDNKLISHYNINNGAFVDVNHKMIGGKRNKRSTKQFKGHNKNKNTIEEFGGDIGDAFKDVGKAIVGGFKSILKPIVDFFVMLGKIIIWIFDAIVWIFVDLLNPLVWIEDVILGAFVGLQLLTMGILDALMVILRKIFNVFLGPIAKGVWGDEYPDRSKAKCYKMPDCAVPYPVLVATVILPPLGVFMELGLKGWLNIFICACLTLLLYLPGLIYALILLYC